MKRRTIVCSLLAAPLAVSCGSAGTYSLLQPELSAQLRERKLAALGSGGPEVIATANIGCLGHLQGASSVPVRHWNELLDEGSGSAENS